MKIYRIILLLTLLANVAIAQENNPELLKMQQEYKAAGLPIPQGLQPEVGKPMPDFTLNKVTSYGSNNVSLKDFKGKWLILDFWATTCATCIASFPKMNAIQEKFKDQLQIILIGDNASKYGKNIQNMYEKVKKARELKLVSAYDSLLKRNYGIVGVPHQIIIDDKGMVIARTPSVTEGQLEKLFKGETVIFSGGKSNSIDAFDDNGNLNNNEYLLYSSSFSKSILTEKMRVPDINDHSEKIKETGLFCIAKWHLAGLYNLAYTGKASGPMIFSETQYGKTAAWPVVEVSDKSLFNHNFSEADQTGVSMKGVYNYSVRIPKENATVENVKKAMQMDLKKYFGYDVSKEKRLIRCMKLVVMPKITLKIKTKGGDANKTVLNQTGMSMISQKIDYFIPLLVGLNQNGPIIYNETGIDYNVDLKVDAMMDDLSAVKKELQKSGLDLVEFEKELEVLVIKDPTKK
ncbi:TlpA disulfide reductase family protein [Pedobacter heparinus]|uniref:TlpA family protein disulfide reductase n=1 Tax=Pedobacter heparinus TaxID=984 RepID=UPI00292FB9D2|nr:TlpA disulfide reductase family protein [Pedobacter heparinus]